MNIEHTHDGQVHTIGTHTQVGRIQLCCPGLFRKVRGQQKVKREVYQGFLLIAYTFRAFRERKYMVSTCAIYGFDILQNQVYFVGYCRDRVIAKKFIDSITGPQPRAAQAAKNIRPRPTPDMKPIKRSIRSKV